MSDRDLARRARVEVFFDGVDISKSIGTNLISLTYTDNEEDEADDLQIKLHDRESIWMEEWLAKAIESAASAGSLSATGKSSSNTYKVTPKSGLNVRSGPGANYAKIGMLTYGASVKVQSIESGWAKIDHNGKTAYVSAQHIKAGSQGVGTHPTTEAGLRIQAIIVRENWHGDGKDDVLPCGQFELDGVDCSGPPSSITIKGTALPFSSQVRQTPKNKSWEKYKLSGIANEMAEKNGMACLFECSDDPYYERVEQYMSSDIALLSKLCHDAGISLKVTNNILVLFDQVAYEAKDPVFTVRKGSGYTKYKVNTGKAAAQYASCRVSYIDPATKRLIEAVARVEDYDAKKKDNQQLEVKAKVSSIAEAKKLAEKRLRLHNKHAKTASFTYPGNPDLVAGATVMLDGWGYWDGKYIVKQAVHTVSSSGYITQITVRTVLEGY